MWCKEGRKLNEKSIEPPPLCWVLQLFYLASVDNDFPFEEDTFGFKMSFQNVFGVNLKSKQYIFLTTGSLSYTDKLIDILDLALRLF